MRWQHWMDRTPGQFAMADLATLGAAEPPGLTDE